MTSQLNITAKIWLSVGVFIVGYVASTTLGQVNGVATEGSLRTTSEALFPAAQRSQEAESAFQRAVKTFGDAVLTQDASGVERAGEDGKAAIENLRGTAQLAGLPEKRSRDAMAVVASMEQFLEKARRTYGGVVGNPTGMNSDTQEQMRVLASQTEAIKGSLREFKDQCSGDLKSRLGALAASSASQRRFALIVFVSTLAIATLIVNLTIRRAITGPVKRVIAGVRHAADEAARTSEKMANSGQVVARNAQEQAACIQQTSASLDQMSATTRENANRAKEADGLMRQARETVGRATQDMSRLQLSMEAISKSSNEVAAVLRSIDEIAFHTNILALNAAVEAARAGDAGAGFSVVADEVRSLAQRAAEAARNSADIVEKTIADVNHGVQFVGTANGAFREVSAAIGSGGAVVSLIAKATDEQARGISQIGQAISQIEAVTQNNSATAQHTAEAAAAMLDQVRVTRANIDGLMAVVGFENSDAPALQ